MAFRINKIKWIDAWPTITQTTATSKCFGVFCFWIGLKLKVVERTCMCMPHRYTCFYAANKPKLSATFTLMDHFNSFCRLFYSSIEIVSFHFGSCLVFSLSNFFWGSNSFIFYSIVHLDDLILGYLRRSTYLRVYLHKGFFWLLKRQSRADVNEKCTLMQLCISNEFSFVYGKCIDFTPSENVRRPYKI